jgi:hypothetical protein
MATLNHTNLTTYNVPGLKEFFRSVFDFQVLEERGDKFAVLRNPEGFLLTLMYDKRMTPGAGLSRPVSRWLSAAHPACGGPDARGADCPQLHGSQTRAIAARRTAHLRFLL